MMVMIQYDFLILTYLDNHDNQWSNKIDKHLSESLNQCQEF